MVKNLSSKTEKDPEQGNTRQKSVMAGQLGVCTIEYMGNTYSFDDLTKRECQLKVQDYPGATIVSWKPKS